MSSGSLDIDGVRGWLARDELSGELVYLSSCPSTNDIALEIDPGAQPQGWAAVITDEQTAGRGRLDRTWDSQWGTGVLLSVVSQSPASVHNSRLGVLPLAVGATVATALRERGVSASVKWPNDIVVPQPHGWGKLGGLLLQSSPPSMVVGVGLNYDAAPALPADQRGQVPTTLRANGLHADVTREQVAADVIAAVVDVRDRFLAGQTEELLEEYRVICATIGADAAVTLPGGAQVSGRVDDVAADGQLVLRTTDGQRRLINSADVVVLNPAGPTSVGG